MSPMEAERLDVGTVIPLHVAILARGHLSY